MLMSPRKARLILTLTIYRFILLAIYLNLSPLGRNLVRIILTFHSILDYYNKLHTHAFTNY